MVFSGNGCKPASPTCVRPWLTLRAARAQNWSPWCGQFVNAGGHVGPLADSQGSRRYAPLVARAVVAARFLPVWLATGVLLIVAAIIAPNALQQASWAYVLPYMTILAVAALGQMLVIMQAGIDLSTPGVISLGGNLVVGVSLGIERSTGARNSRVHRARRGSRPCQRSARRDREAEPADRHAGRRADRVGVEPEVLARR